MSGHVRERMADAIDCAMNCCDVEGRDINHCLEDVWRISVLVGADAEWVTLLERPKSSSTFESGAIMLCGY